MTQEFVPTAENNAVEIYNKSVETFRGGAEVLVKTQNTVAAALAVGEKIEQQIKDNGNKLTPELDQLCNDFIAKCNTRLKERTEERKPITQIMDAVKKLFTAEENKLDVKDSSTVSFRIQHHRNEYAREVAERKQRELQEAQRKADKDREAVDIKAEAERRIAKHFNDFLFSKKEAITSEFNNTTLDNYNGRLASLQAFEPVYPYDHFKKFIHGLYGKHHTMEEVNLIVNNTVVDKFEGFAQTYKGEMLELKSYYLDRFPSKKKELDDMAAADVAEKQRLEQQKLQREQEEKERLQKKQDELQKQQEADIANRKTEGDTLALFNQVAEVSQSEGPETREGFEIEVTHPAGYLLIMNLWFEKEGSKLGSDKIEKKTVAQMKAFCEKLAHKDDIRISSDLIKYKPTYKAVNRKGDN